MTEVSLPMVGENTLILPEYFVQKNKKKIKKKGEYVYVDVYKLVNPLTKTRHLAKRGGEPVIKLVRKPIEDMVLDELNRDIPLSKFGKADRNKIIAHFEEIEKHKDKLFWKVPDSGKFKNKERGRPEVLPRNIQVNKERAEAKKRAEPKKKTYATDEERKEAIKQQKRESAKRTEKRAYKKYDTEEERLEAIKQQKRDSAKKRRAEISGKGIKEDFQRLGQKIKNTARNVGNTIVHKTKEATNTVKHYVNAVVKGRNDYPPKVRSILEQKGAKIIDGITICRTPVPGILTGALSALSGGAFGKALQNAPYDKLYHLFIRIKLDDGSVVSLEKNEVINMDIDPPIPKDTDQKQVSNVPRGIVVDGLLEGARRIQGGKFFGYSARDNNCQDFILAVFNGSNIGNEEDRAFIKQDTKQLFGDNVALRKISNTVTDLGGIVNTITTGAGIKKKSSYKNMGRKRSYSSSDDDMDGRGIKESFNNSKFGQFINKTAKKHKGIIDAVRNDESVQNLYHGKHISPFHKDIDAVVRHFEGEGIKEMFNDSKLGKAINKSVKKHKGIIDAVRNDESVQNLYHGKHIAPFHRDIDAVVNHFGSGLGTGVEGAAHHFGHMGNGLYAGNPSYGGQIHHHHHLHIEGGGMWDWADPNKNGVARAFDPNQNGVARAFAPVTNVVQQVPRTPEDFRRRIQDELEKRGLNNKNALQGLKTTGHYVIPATTSALGGAAGTALGGLSSFGAAAPLGGIAGSALGAYVGDKINQKIGIGLHKRKGRFVKGSQEAKDHMRKIREMKRK